MIKIEIICGIYKILNKINGNFYIGSAKNIKARWATHISELNNKKHHNDHLQKAWYKYGFNAFQFIIIKTCKISNLLIIEQFYIDTLKPVYNICKIAGGSDTISNHPNRQEICKANSIRMKEYLKDKTKNPMYGKNHSEKTRSQMKLNWHKTRKFEKPINQIDIKTGKIIKTYKGIKEAVRSLGRKDGCGGAISNVCKKHTKTAIGFKWEYVETKTEPQITTAPSS